MIGKTISHYKILEKLGEGGMGVVYKAEDTRLNRFVALKFLPYELTENLDAKERFKREARTASSIDHTNICTIYEINEAEDEQLFISMAYYEGVTLKQKMDSGPLPVDQAVDIAIQICEGLRKAHEKGLIHRDIKPANIFITDDGTVKILDFGIARLAGQTRFTKEKTTVGTIAYISPEQARGEETDHRTDIWAVGVILYEMLTGKLPFKGDYDQVMIYSILNEKPKKVTSISADIPVECERIIDKALQKEITRRYHHINRMANDLNEVKETLKTHASKGKISLFHRQKMKKHFITIGIFMLLITFFFIFKPIIFKNKQIVKPISIAVISFENQTGNTAYDYLQNAIPNLLITSLEQSPNLQVATWERLYDLLKQAGKENISNIDQKTGFELCALDGIDAVVLGSFIKTGDVFATELKVLDVNNQNLLTSVRSEGTGIESILKHQIDQLSDEISGDIVHPQQFIEYAPRKIMDVTTSSMEAYRYFIRAMDEYYRYGYGNLYYYLGKAIDTDTTFAMAYLWFGRSLGPNIADKNIFLMKAQQFSQRATKKEQLYIKAELETNIEKKIQIYQQLLDRFPNEKHPYKFIIEYLMFHGEYESAIEACMKVLKLDPYFIPALSALCYIHADTGDDQKANEYLKHFAAMRPGDIWPMIVEAYFHYMDGKFDAAMGKYKEAYEINPGFDGEFYIANISVLQRDFDQAIEWMNKLIERCTVGTVVAYSSTPMALCFRSVLSCLTGQYNDALRDLELAYGVFIEWINIEYISLCDALLGAVYYEKKDYEKSRWYLNHYQKILAMNKNPASPDFARLSCEPLLGLIDLQQGYMDSVRIRLQNKHIILANTPDAVKNLTHYHYQLLEAEYLLQQSSTEAAIAVGESIREIAQPQYYFFYDRILFYNLPFSKDILARAYLKQGNIDKAIAEYERLIQFDPAGKDRRWMHPKYHYDVAKLYQEIGDIENAVKNLKRFLEIWNNADENNPELIDARKRLKVLDPYFINMNLTGKHQKKDASINHSAMFGSYDSYPMITAANSYYLKGRLDQAIEIYEAAVEMNPYFSGQIPLAFITALQPDFDQAIEWVNAYIPVSSAGLTEPGARAYRGFFNCLIGQYDDAFIDLNFAINKFKQWESYYYQALCEAVMGLLFYEKQDFKKSKMYFNNYMKIVTGKNIATTFDFINFSCEPFLGLIDIRQGNMDSARKRLEKKHSVLSGLHLNVKDLTKFHYQYLEAEFLLAQDSTDAAIAIAENIKELAPPLYHFNGERLLFYNSPFSKDILARAYLKKGNIDKAIAEYERLIHFNPASKDRRLMYPKYHYYVARLYQEKDEKENAVKHLNQFLEIWKNADEDIPELIDAKKRLKELTNQ